MRWLNPFSIGVALISVVICWGQIRGSFLRLRKWAIEPPPLGHIKRNWRSGVAYAFALVVFWAMVIVAFFGLLPTP